MGLEGQQFGRYRLSKLLGGGSMGEVYQAEDVHIRRQVAVKVIRAETASHADASEAQESARLFRREIRAIAILDHPHILPLFDYGEETLNNLSLTYMVMPIRLSGSLTTWVQQRGGFATLSLQYIAHFVQQAASGLQYAHRHQVIHQDVKPSNFLIRLDEEENGPPNLQLADFGVAKLFTSTSSMSQTSRGTPAFMAPEQWSGNPVPASDQYALAIMAYQMLTGNPPFQGRAEQVMFHHFRTQPTPPSKLNSRIPAELDAVILRGLAKQPEARYPQIIDFARALRQAIESTNTATIARPTPSTQLPTPPTPPQLPIDDLRATLAISDTEARSGTTRTLTLPGGRKVFVQVPPQTSDGHIIRLEGQGEPSGHGNTGALVINIQVKRPEDERPPHTPAELTQRSTPPHIPSPNTPPQVQASVALSTKQPFKQTRTNLAQKRVLLPVSVVLVVLIVSGFVWSVTHQVVTMPYPPGKGVLALNDTLSTSNTNWPDKTDNTGNSCHFTGGSYHIISQQAITFHSCIADTTFSNFAYEVQMTISKGDGGGIIFRSDTSGANFYYFAIYTDGSFTLWLVQNNSLTNNLANGPASTISNTSTGQQNLIAVVANGSTITLYVNHHQIVSVQDSTYSQGQIGVVADDERNATEIAFSNAKVWTF